MSLAKNLDAQMKAKGLSATDLAAASGVTTACVYQWLKGTTKRPKQIDLVAKAVGSSADALLSGKRTASAGVKAPKPKAKAAATKPRAAAPRKVARKPVAAAKSARRRSVGK